MPYSKKLQDVANPVEVSKWRQNEWRIIIVFNKPPVTNTTLAYKVVTSGMALTIRELSSRTFSDFEKIAAKQGGCWCMYYQRAKPIRLKSSDPEWKKINRKDKRALVERGQSHAILVYENETPVGWCQYGAKEELPRIDAGRGYRKVGSPVGAEKLWRITCFFVDRDYRGKGVAKLALNAALESIKRQGGGVVEAYPIVSKKMAAVAEWRWFGTPSMFKREGFEKIAPLGTSMVLMRKTISTN